MDTDPKQDPAKAYLDKVAKIQKFYEDRARHSPTPWYLYTDGSGQVDVPGAAAHVVYHRTDNAFKWGVSSHSRTTVERVELQALLNGLHDIADRELSGRHQAILNGDEPRIQVVWVGDRENLIRSVLRDEHDMTLNRRRINLDQWSSLTYWEQFFEILPIQRPRNTVGAQAAADLICGSARKALRLFMTEIAQAVHQGLGLPEQPQEKTE